MFRCCFFLAIILAIFLHFPRHSFAQNEQTINQRDEQGRAHGLWYMHQKGGKGEPEQSIIGHYDHGNKTGIWYVSDSKGNICSIENYKHNVRDGEAKYFEQGQLTCVGHYRGLNPSVALDTVHIVDPITGAESWVSVPTERGSVRHGNWRFYDELSGRLVREEHYQVDEIIFKQDFTISASDSAAYARRNRLLPHNANKLPPASKFKSKEPTKSLIGG